MDVVALAQSGFANAVATLGTACTAEHVQKLFRFTDSVVFSFDGDAAGRRAAGRALEASLPHATDTRSVRFLFLPAEHDPDSLRPRAGRRGLRGLHRAGGAAVAPARRGRRRRSRPRHRRRPGPHACQRTPAVGRSCPTARSSASCSGDLATRRRGCRRWNLALWGRCQPGRRPSPAPRSGGRPGAVPPPGRVSRAAANLLDRALWLLLQRGELWAAWTAKRTICWRARHRLTGPVRYLDRAVPNRARKRRGRARRSPPAGKSDRRRRRVVADRRTARTRGIRGLGGPTVDRDGPAAPAGR